MVFVLERFQLPIAKHEIGPPTVLETVLQAGAGASSRAGSRSTAPSPAWRGLVRRRQREEAP